MTVPATPVPWPDAARCAASFSFDVDAESAMLAVDHGNANRMSAMSHQAYGPLVGVPRILKILARHEITSTFFVPGYTAVRYPDVVRSIVAEGHEIAHHGYLHEPMAGLSAEEEAAILDRGLDALEKAVDDGSTQLAGGTGDDDHARSISCSNRENAAVIIGNVNMLSLIMRASSDAARLGPNGAIERHEPRSPA
jgi:peptidoglycan/xylan/chitin deacetylase (PgdA/CDA1 family)